MQMIWKYFSVHFSWTAEQFIILSKESEHLKNSFKLTVKFLFKIKFSSVSNCLNDLMTSKGRWQGPTRVGRRQKTAIKCDRDHIEWVWPRDRVHPIAHPARKNVWQQFAIKQNIEHTTSPFCCDDRVKCDKINVRVRRTTKTTWLTKNGSDSLRCVVPMFTAK